MRTVLRAWGNSQGIRIPKEIMNDAGFHLNESLTIEVRGESIVISKVFQHRSLEERAAAYHNKLNLSEETDWGTSTGDELW